ncbi:unnamed protein product [Nyctereutes procyonoides]|uniref:(raccoon dog) hypothetical protein n=1 Tax=Nyctereutes procyonoides TaxID=34880 RepID=A0A811ZT29_NYCPR|nr:unnamed protein product [Nyctereutes procyonoides]
MRCKKPLLASERASTPEAQKSQAGAKKNEKESAGERPVLYEDPLTPRSENLPQKKPQREETECSENKLSAEPQELPELSHQYRSVRSDKKGYRGVGLLFHPCPLKSGVPGGRQCWDGAFCKFLKGLASHTSLGLCGNLSVAHEEIHLLYPKGNKQHAGFTRQERHGFGELLRLCHWLTVWDTSTPNLGYAYTFWTYVRNVPSIIVGWHLDYFLLSHSLLPCVV